MWALKNSFLVSMSTMYLNFNRRKSRLQTVSYTLLACESQRSLLSKVIPKRRRSDTWPFIVQFWTKSSGKGDKWCLSGSDCHRLSLDRIDDHIMIIITPIGYLISAVLHIASDLQSIFSRCVQCCVICQHVTFKEYNYFSRVMEGHWYKRQRQSRETKRDRDSDKERRIHRHLFYFIFMVRCWLTNQKGKGKEI